MRVINIEKKHAYQKVWYEKNKDREIRRIDKRRKEIKEWLDEYKSHCTCTICGENRGFTIEFHHTIDEKDFEIAAIVSKGMSLKNILKELEKCVPLCANCHRGVTLGIIKLYI